MHKNERRRIAVLDLETDPFLYGQMVHPFAAGFYDGSTYSDFWGADCVAKLVDYLEKLSEPLTIYAHNGGRFDYFFFLPYIRDALRIVNSRIIQAHLGKHELRDSFAIMPFALDKYQKTSIDYNKLLRERREQHKPEIRAYLKDDCTNLYTLCVAFQEEFGDALTIGSASMKQLRKFHQFARGNEIFDARFRKDFYFGGRNQVFRSGIIHGPIKIYDVNSMYPHAMRDYLHPVSTGILVGNRIDKNTCYVSVEGKNFGAFPTRQKDNSLDFTIPSGIFHTSIHEYEAALDTGTFKPRKILKTYGFNRRESFDTFVNHFYDARMIAKEKGDTIRTLFYKFVLNSGYGKFAQNPENYCDWFIAPVGSFPPEWHQCVKSCDEICRLKWSPSFLSSNDYIIWSRPLRELNHYNIATGASITGAARAVLLRGLQHARNPIYCDTDSIICNDLSGVTISETELGAWKLETEGDMIAVCGKKLYAVYQGKECIKKAHKGMRLTGEEILKVAKGHTVESCNPVPAFKWDGSYSFTSRRARMTV